MTTLRYSFRPSLFQSSRTVVLDDTGIAVLQEGAEDRRAPWSAIEEVHIEPSTAGDDDRTRWLLHLAPAGGERITIDSVDVKGAADFEHKTEAFAEALRFVHGSLAPRGDAVRYRFGARRGVVWAWRAALILTLAAGIFGVVAAIVAEQFDGILYGGLFAAFGLFGLIALRGRGGPVAYDPAGFADEWPAKVGGRANAGRRDPSDK